MGADAVFWCEIGAAALMGAAVVVAMLGPRKLPPLSSAPGGGYEGPPRVLVVDDEPSFAKLMKRLLASHGVEVDVAHTCQAARVLADRYPYELIIVDRMLPDGNGVVLLEKLRPQTMVYTGIDADAVAALQEAHAADLVLEKRGDLHELEEAALGLLKRRSG